jgi:hypothetical protein
VGATSVTRSFTSVVASVLDKVRSKVEDQITSSTKLLYFYRKSGNWKGTGSGGDRYRVSLMYELAAADSYSSFGQIDVTPTDGITSAFFDWRQGATAVSISGLEEFKNRGSERVFDLLKERTVQSVLGLEDLFSKGMLQGQAAIDGTSITSARTSPINGSTFIDPLPLLVEYSPLSTVGSISATTETWWKNQLGGTTGDSGATTYAGFLMELRHLYNLCAKGGGGAKGSPDFHLTDQSTYELYESALAAAHRNPSYTNADIPFENVSFKGKPVVWDEYVPDVKNGDVTPTGSDSGTWYALNSNYLGVSFDKSHNFTVGDFVNPENQDAKTALVLWYGTHWTSNRRKLGVMGGINTTIAA